MSSSSANGNFGDEDPNRSIGPMTGLNFRDLMGSLEEKAVEEGLFDVADYSKSNTLLSNSKFGRFVDRLTSKSKKVINFIVNRVWPLGFFYELIAYLVMRLRVIFVLISVLFEVLGGYLEVVKRLVIRKMFWGRGSLFKFSLQFFSVFVLVLLFLSNTYQDGVIEAGYQLEYMAANGVGSASGSDVFVQNSSTQTLINEDAGRIESKIYIVKGGDTLSTIASEFNLKTQTLLWANDLSTNDFIRPGMELVIPLGDGVIVEVKKGDTVETLAEDYNTLGQLIVDINALVPPYTLEVGQEIFLPDGEMPAPPTPVVQAPIYSGIVSPSPSTGTPVPVTGGNRWLIWPVANGGRLTQCYSAWHNGVDIADRSYPNVVAAAPGTVTFSGCQSGSCPPPGQETGGWGLAWTVIVDHGNGYSTIYGHLNKLYVSSGQKVSAGQALGQMGQSGRAYGIHVHFMVVYSGTWNSVNPAKFMSTHICGY